MPRQVKLCSKFIALSHEFKTGCVVLSAKLAVLYFLHALNHHSIHQNRNPKKKTFELWNALSLICQELFVLPGYVWEQAKLVTHVGKNILWFLNMPLYKPETKPFKSIQGTLLMSLHKSRIGAFAFFIIYLYLPWLFLMFRDLGNENSDDFRWMMAANS